MKLEKVEINGQFVAERFESDNRRGAQIYRKVHGEVGSPVMRVVSELSCQPPSFARVAWTHPVIQWPSGTGVMLHNARCFQEALYWCLREMEMIEAQNQDLMRDFVLVGQ